MSSVIVAVRSNTTFVSSAVALVGMNIPPLGCVDRGLVAVWISSRMPGDSCYDTPHSLRRKGRDSPPSLSFPAPHTLHLPKVGKTADSGGARQGSVNRLGPGVNSVGAPFLSPALLDGIRDRVLL